MQLNSYVLRQIVRLYGITLCFQCKGTEIAAFARLRWDSNLIFSCGACGLSMSHVLHFHGIRPITEPDLRNKNPCNASGFTAQGDFECSDR
jgi:hypothetical protein